MASLVSDPRLIPQQWWHYEDPFEGLFTESIPFSSGCHIVLPGIVPDGPYVLRRLLEAVFHDRELGLPAEYRLAAKRLATAALLLSDAVARRAGLGRNALVGRFAPGVAVPDQSRLDRLRRAVIFSDGELQDLLEPHGVPLDALSPLTLQGPSRAHGPESEEESLLESRPILHVDGRFIVALPCAITSALRHALLRLAHEHGALKDVARAFRRATVISIMRRMIREWGAQPAGTTASHFEPEGPDEVFTIDFDRTIALFVEADPLEGFDPSRCHKVPPRDSLSDRLKARIQRYEGPTTPFRDDSLCLSVIQGLGYDLVAGWKTPPCRASHFLCIPGSELDQLIMLEGDDPTSLFHYARSHEYARTRVEVMTFGTLDEYESFRAAKCSHSFAFEGNAVLISITPGDGRAIREQVARERDPHPVANSDARSYTEVQRRPKDPPAPTYVSSGLDGEVKVLLEGTFGSLWVVSEGEHPAGSGELLFMLCDAIAYWAWQLDDVLCEILEKPPPHSAVWVIRIHLEDPEIWIHDGPVDEGRPIVRAVRRADREVEVHIGPGMRDRFSAGNNRGEREIMEVILRALLVKPTVEWSSPSFPGWKDVLNRLDQAFSPGGKRMIDVAFRNSDPRHDGTALPRFRKVHLAEETRLLLQLGTRLAELGLRLGHPVPPDQTGHVLKDVVTWYYSQFKSLVASIAPEGLLEFLIDQNERCIHDQAMVKLVAGRRLLCYGSLPGVEEGVGEAFRSRNIASLASRVLIEFVASSPSSGTMPMCNATYDTLLALTAGIVGWGSLSDVHHLNVVPLPLKVARSGILNVDNQVGQRVADAFVDAWVGDQGVRASRTSTSGSQDSDGEELLQRFDQGTRAEFGLSLRELVATLVAIEQMSDPVSPWSALTTEEMVERLSVSLSWPTEKVRTSLAFFTLAPRPDYLDPPTGFKRADIYPWQFNRALSYLRRPLLQHNREGAQELVWGRRNLHVASMYLMDLCATGKLRASSESMRRALGSTRTGETALFVKSIAASIPAAAGRIVKQSVWKIGGRRLIGEDGNDLGDIDVLVVDVAKHIIVLIEAKDFLLARTPIEFANELRKLLPTPGSRSSAVQRQEMRTKWVSARIPETLKFAGVAPGNGGKWRVRPLIVISQEGIARLLNDTGIPIIPFRSLDEWIRTGRIWSHR